MYHKESPLSQNAIAEYAERLLDHHKPEDMRDLAKKLGGKVEQHTRHLAKRFLDVDKPGRFTIWLPTVQGERRDTFCIARGIGYYMLHYLYPGLEQCMHYSAPGHHHSMVQANIFALNLLAPREKFIELYQEFDGDLMKVTQVLPISDKAALHRAVTLGIYDEKKDPFLKGV